MDDDLTDDERRALATYLAPEPPAGFVDRVIDGPAPKRSRAWIFAALGAAAVAAAIAFVATRGGGTQSGGGAITAETRRSISIGDRAVVVTESGTSLSWTSTDGEVRAEQPTGNAFYRVDHGGPFVVATPLGEVRVTGTCFRVEVNMKKSPIVGGAIGAAIAAAVVVTVYEGGVVVAGHHDSTARVAAGERATITGEGVPVVSPASSTTPIALETTAPPTGATREQLLARDESQRQQIATLTTRVAELEKRVSEHGEPNDGRPWYDPSPERLAEFAKNCEIRLDMPPVLTSTPFTLDAEAGKHWGLTDEQRERASDTLGQLQRDFAERIRKVYIDVVGERAELDLSAQAMIQEIQDKSPPAEAIAIKARIAQERAGLAKPPADWSKAPPIERMFRLMAGLGDETEKLLASKVGTETAHAARAKEGGWGNKWSMSGCDDK